MLQAIVQIENGKIKSIEKTSGRATLIIDGKQFDYPGGWLYPGMTDAHGHVAALGKFKRGMAVVGTKSAGQCVQLLEQNRFMQGKWLTAWGWNQEQWKSKCYPDKDILDFAFSDTPVFLKRIDGHAAWVNTVALNIAGIDNNTPDPAGGKIQRDKSGNATGILIDTAMNIVSKHIPPFTDQQIMDNIDMGCRELSSVGLTSTHDMDLNPLNIPAYKKLDEESKLTVRVSAYIKAHEDEWLKHSIKPYIGNRFEIKGLKFYADGALGSHGAALLRDYKDMPGNRGLLLTNFDRLLKQCRKGCEAGFDIAVHAIGDAANRLVIDVYEQLRKDGFTNNLRIEHVQIIHPEDADRMAENNIIASVQPIHGTSDMTGMAQDRMDDETLGRAYRWKSLAERGLLLCGGSDYPIESHDPLTGIDAFVKQDSSWS